MPLVECSQCGKKYWGTYLTCPHCGRQLGGGGNGCTLWFVRLLLLLVGGALVLGLLVVVASCLSMCVGGH